MRQTDRLSSLPFIILAAIVIPVWLMSRSLSLPLWFDEAYTLGTFASQPVSQIISDYREPNNHIGFTLLMHPLASMQHDPLIQRLPSFLSSLLLLILVYRLASRTFDHRCAICSVLLLGTNQVYLNYATQVRGYSLSMLLITALVYVTIRPTNTPAQKTGRFLAIILCGSYSIYTIPTNVLFVAPVAITSIGMNWRNGGWKHGCGEIILFAVTAIVSAAMYFPVLNQIQQTAAGSLFSYRELTDRVLSFFLSITQDIPFLTACLFLIPFTLLCLRKVIVPDQQQRNLLVLLSAAISGSFLLAAVLRVAPFDRNFLPALPLLTILIGSGMSGTWSWLNHAFTRAEKAAVLFASVLLVMQLHLNLTFAERLSNHRVNGYPESLYYHYTAAEFEPEYVTGTVSQSFRRHESYLCVMTERAWQNLGFHFSAVGCPTFRYRMQSGLPVADTIYVISMAPVNPDQLANLSGLPPDLFEDMTFETSGGFLIATIRKTTQLPDNLTEGLQDAVPKQH